MTAEGSQQPNGASRVPQSFAGWVARRESLPLSVRAVIRYYAETGVLDPMAIKLEGYVDEAMDAILDTCWAAVEDALERELGFEDPEFEYETKLTMPLELTLGYLYRDAIESAPEGVNPVTYEPPLVDQVQNLSAEDRSERRRSRFSPAAVRALETVERAESFSQLVAEALLDGDMRDAINDEEYEDFVLDRPLSDDERARVADVAQACLQERVEDGFVEYPDGVRDAYEQAVERSERHQSEDERFRELLTAARDGDDEAVASIESEYKFADFAADPDVLTPADRELPHCKTQYDRVGVIYAGMLEMFEAAGFEIEDAFTHSIVLSIIGAQIWLDDVDDYEADVRDGQLTPVTAEYVLADSEHAAYESVVDVTTQYLDAAIEYARASDSTLTGIATEYIYLSGDPETLPGSN